MCFSDKVCPKTFLFTKSYMKAPSISASPQLQTTKPQLFKRFCCFWWMLFSNSPFSGLGPCWFQWSNGVSDLEKYVCKCWLQYVCKWPQRFFRSLATSSASAVDSGSSAPRSIQPTRDTETEHVSGVGSGEPRRCFFKSLRRKEKQIQTNTEQPEQDTRKDLKTKINFTMKSLLEFQHVCKVHAELAPPEEKPHAKSILEHHRRPNYNNTRRRLFAKGRSSCEQLARKK